MASQPWGPMPLLPLLPPSSSLLLNMPQQRTVGEGKQPPPSDPHPPTQPQPRQLTLTLTLTTDPDPNPDPHPNQASKPTSLEYYYRQRFDPSQAREGSVAADGLPSEGGASAEETGNATFEEAQWMCMYSVAAYSLVQYILALKDRHNGNILVDSRGRMVHLGFSYVLGWAPGGMTFEKTAFKLTRDVVDVWGGRGSPIYDEFTNVMVQVS